MKGLASFVMRGLSQSVMVSTVLALLSLLLPLFGVLSAASVGLVTLRNGAKSGIIVSLLTTLACILFLAASLGYPIPTSWSLLLSWPPILLGLGFLLLQWAPVVVLGQFLRASRSLDLAIQLALGFGLLVILSQYLLLADPIEFWQTQFEPLVDQLVTAGVIDQANRQAVLTKLAGWMVGVLAAGFYLQLACSLLVARWWQALLYNPGGFREEFHRFRLHKTLGVLGFAAIVILLMPSQELPGILRHLAILLSAILFLAGLAVTHGVLGKMSSSGLWLGVVYFLLIFLLPQVAIVLATVGLMDVWIDFRARFERGRSTG